MHHHRSRLQIPNLEGETLPKDYKLSVYDGSYEDYKKQTQEELKKQKEELKKGKQEDHSRCKIF